MSWGAWKKYADIRGSTCSDSELIGVGQRLGIVEKKKKLSGRLSSTTQTEDHTTLIYTLLRSITGEKTNTQGDKMTLLDKTLGKTGLQQNPCTLLTALGDGRASQECGHAAVLGVGLFADTVVNNRESMGTKQITVSPSRVNWTSFSGVQMSVIKHVLHQMPSAGIR